MNRILKDIRYYESDKENIDGNSFPGNLGRLFHPTEDTNYIGQRIARKLNELDFSYGEYDHIYINLTTAVNESDLLISKRNIDKRIKYIDYGLSPKKYNALANSEKDVLLISITFSVLRYLSASQYLMLKKVEEVERMVNKLDTGIRIKYKTKETSNYRIDISYQIRPVGATTRAIVEYLNKKDNTKLEGFIPLHFYDDIYSLIDTISLKDDVLIFNPKKSFIAGVSNKRYSTPISLKLSELKAL